MLLISWWWKKMIQAAAPLGNYFKDSEESQWHMHDFVNGESSLPCLFQGSYRLTSGKFLKSAASQSPSKYCRAAAVGNKKSKA